MKKLLLSLAVIFCLTAGSAMAAEEYSFQSFWTTSHQLNKLIIEPWCKNVTENSGGKVIMHYNGNNALVKADSVAGAIRSGNLDAGGIQMQTAVAMMPLSQLLALPFIVQNADEACTLYREMYKTFPEIRSEIDKNFKLVTLMGSDRYCFASTKSLIKTPADLKGKRVLVWAPYQIEEVKSWGGMPVQIASSETYMGLQRGLGEVAYVPAPAMDSNKLAEVAKYITLIPSRSLPMIIAINWDAWKSMPKDVQKYIDSISGDVLSDQIGKGLVELTARDMIKHVNENKCEVYELNLAEQKVFKDMADEANDKYWTEMLQRNGVKNPKEWMGKVEALAAKTFNR